MGLHDISGIISGIRGADYADLYAAKMVSHKVMYDDGRMDTLSSSRGSGLGIRLIIGGNSVYAHTMGTKIADAGEAVRQAAQMSGLTIPNVSGEEDLMPETELSGRPGHR